jgi:formate hydrogenlyase subunit 3/multisubunit Na+/H+ antiporter MnhD subunit
VTQALLVATALTGLVAALAGATAPVRFRVGLSTALTIAACALGLIVGVDVIHTGHAAVVSTGALMPLSRFSLSLNRFGALFVIISSVIGICAMVFRTGYTDH